MFRDLANGNKSAASTIEYVALVVFLLTVFFLFQKYIYRGLMGRWHSVGQSSGYGLRYDPNKTIQCEFDFLYTNRWYNLECYENKCDCESVAASTTSCRDCITINCTTVYCD